METSDQPWVGLEGGSESHISDSRYCCYRRLTVADADAAVTWGQQSLSSGEGVFIPWKLGDTERSVSSGKPGSREGTFTCVLEDLAGQMRDGAPILRGRNKAQG